MPKQGNLGRAGSKRKRPDPINQAINQPSNWSQEIPERTKTETRKMNHMYSMDPAHSINNANDRIVNNNPFIPDAPFHPDSILRPPIKPTKQSMTQDQSSQNVQDINPNINFDLKKTHHFKKASCQKHFKHQTNNFFKNLKN